MFKIHRFIPLLIIALLIIAAFHLGCDELITQQITTIEAGHPIADFQLETHSLDYGCAHHAVQFWDESNGPRDKYLWTFGDGDSSTDTNPSHTYDTAGMFTVTLKIWDTEKDGYDAEVKSRFILVGTTNSGFSSSPTTGCQGLEVTFTPDVISNKLSYSWNFGDSLSSGDSTSTDTVATHIFDSAGTFIVSLTVTDSCGMKTTVDTIEVNNCPTWGFQTSDTSVCVDVPVTFEDISQPADGYIMFYDSADWWFGDAGRAIDNGSPTHSYSSPGTYTIALQTVSDGGTLRDSIVGFITVHDSTVANFDIVGGTARCYSPTQQLNVKFVSTSTGTLDSILWDFGDGFTLVTTDTEAIHNYTGPGRFTVGMTAYGVCNTNGFSITNAVTQYDPFDSTQVDFSTLFDSLTAGDTLVDTTYDSTFDTTVTDPLTVDTLVDTLADSTFDSLYYYTFEDLSTPIVYLREWNVTSLANQTTTLPDSKITGILHLADSSYTVSLSIYNPCDTVTKDTVIIVRPTK